MVVLIKSALPNYWFWIFTCAIISQKQKYLANLSFQDEFMIFSGRRKFVRRVFLFEDMILFSKPIRTTGGHDIYQYKCSYKVRRYFCSNIRKEKASFA